MRIKIKMPRWGDHGCLHSQAWKKEPKVYVEGGDHQSLGSRAYGGRGEGLAGQEKDLQR